MQIFIYEWVCGGGYLDRTEPPPASLLAEGSAMLAAVVEDFSRVPDVCVATVLQTPLPPMRRMDAEVHVVDSPQERDRVCDRLMGECDATILIAPEFEGILLGLASRATKLGARLLSPSPEFIEIASDKEETANLLHIMGVPETLGGVVLPGVRCPDWVKYPAIVKPIDGAGSMGVRKLERSCRVPEDAKAFRLEDFVPGTPASVTCVCAGEEVIVLEPCEQRIGDDFAYQGGRLSLREELSRRARMWAGHAVRAFDPTVGFVGVDLILGNTEEEDTVIEVNPRHTTSYVGLRAATDHNLAQLLIDAADGGTVVSPTFSRQVSWNAEGDVQIE